MERPDLHLVTPPAVTAPAADDAERMVDISYIQNDLAGITTMTIWRWSRDPDPEVRFPAPDLMISGRKRLWFLWRYRAWKARIIARGRIDTRRDRHAEEDFTPPAA